MLLSTITACYCLSGNYICLCHRTVQAWIGLQMNAFPTVEYVDGSYLEFGSFSARPTSSLPCVAMLASTVGSEKWTVSGCGSTSRYMCETPKGKVFSKHL